MEERNVMTYARMQRVVSLVLGLLSYALSGAHGQHYSYTILDTYVRGLSPN